MASIVLVSKFKLKECLSSLDRSSLFAFYAIDRGFDRVTRIGTKRGHLYFVVGEYAHPVCLLRAGSSGDGQVFVDSDQLTFTNHGCKSGCNVGVVTDFDEFTANTDVMFDELSWKRPTKERQHLISEDRHLTRTLFIGLWLVTIFSLGKPRSRPGSLTHFSPTHSMYGEWRLGLFTRRPCPPIAVLPGRVGD